MNRIDGRALAASIREEVKSEIASLGLKPKLAVLLVGDDPASQIYVNLKEKAATEAGIATDIRRMPAATPDAELIQILTDWNRDESVDAILIQVPLPEEHDTDAVILAMDPSKDVDGFHPANMAMLLKGQAALFPPVHEGILRLIGATDVAPKTSQAAIIVNSDVFGDPLARLLTQAGAAVDKFHVDDMDAEAVKRADIIVVAVGRPKFLTRDMVKSSACVIDVGTNRLPNGKVVGDVDASNMEDIPGWISPVPGGVGPMTVAMLLKNTLILAKRRRGL